MHKYFWNPKICANICTNKSQQIIMPQMFSQFLVQIFALYKYFRKNLRKKRRKFSMDPICYVHQISKAFVWSQSVWDTVLKYKVLIEWMLSMVSRLSLLKCSEDCSTLGVDQSLRNPQSRRLTLVRNSTLKGSKSSPWSPVLCQCLSLKFIVIKIKF